jgi:hypothetical protein
VIVAILSGPGIQGDQYIKDGYKVISVVTDISLSIIFIDLLL